MRELRFDFFFLLGQWHPERVQYEWDSDEATLKTFDGVHCAVGAVCLVVALSAFGAVSFGDWFPLRIGFASAMQAIQYLSNFFVEECRRNTHVFPSHSDEAKALLYSQASPVFNPDPVASNMLLYRFPARRVEPPVVVQALDRSIGSVVAPAVGDVTSLLGQAGSKSVVRSKPRAIRVG